MLASLGQVAVPTLGMVALSAALLQSGMMGEITGYLAMGLPILGLAVFVAIWLGGRAFPKVQGEDPVLPLPPERRAEGRFLGTMMGLVLAVDGARSLAMDEQAYSDAVTSVATFPILVAGGLLLWRMGRLMRLTPRAEDGGPAQSYVQTLLRLLARVLTVVGPLGVVLATTGYVAAGRALIFPAIQTLGLLTVILILQRLLALVWVMLSPADDTEDREGLVPVLLGFGLTILSLPLFALIWGARLNDLTELWTRFREGFRMGETRISPTDFLLFVVVFAIGYMVTRLFQGALRNSILPRTKMDKGGQTALVSGTGYVGIFLAALIAINATGIDLSGLAIVAGALSVGIGFRPAEHCVQLCQRDHPAGRTARVGRRLDRGRRCAGDRQDDLGPVDPGADLRPHHGDRAERRPGQPAGEELDAVLAGRAADRAGGRGLWHRYPQGRARAAGDCRGAAPGGAEPAAAGGVPGLWPDHDELRGAADPARRQLLAAGAQRHQPPDRRAVRGRGHRDPGAAHAGPGGCPAKALQDLARALAQLQRDGAADDADAAGAAGPARRLPDPKAKDDSG